MILVQNNPWKAFDQFKRYCEQTCSRQFHFGNNMDVPLQEVLGAVSHSVHPRQDCDLASLCDGVRPMFVACGMPAPQKDGLCCPNSFRLTSEGTQRMPHDLDIMSDMTELLLFMPFATHSVCATKPPAVCHPVWLWGYLPQGKGDHFSKLSCSCQKSPGYFFG